MRSRAFAIRNQVWMVLERSPDSSLPPLETFFDSLDTAEALAHDLLSAVELARERSRVD